jgi:23S rRNA (uracil1939-C5)-methyltransferase
VTSTDQIPDSTPGLLTPLPVGRKPRRDDVFDCVVKSLGRRGGAVARWGEYVVELRSGVPGEKLRCEVTKRRGQKIRARVQERLEPSPRAAEVACEHFVSCGGCSFQDSAYDLQLEEQHAGLCDLLQNLRAEHAFDVAPIVAASDVYAYRNKMDFTFAAARWIEEHEPENTDRNNDFALGLHAPGRFDKVLDVTGCAIAFEEASKILNVAREVALSMGLSPWDLRENTGLLRHLVLRKGFRTGEILAYLVTSKEPAAYTAVEAYAQEILRRCPEITTFVQGLRASTSCVSLGEEDLVLHGSGKITDVIGGLTFEISPRSFFQTNTKAAEKLFEIVAEEACPSAEEVVFDLYCGAGTIGLLMAPHCREVWGFEKIEDAVLDARRNAARMGIENAQFFAGDVLETASKEGLAKIGAPSPDVVIVDPPRAGLHPSVAKFLGELAAPRLVYVSCNPKAGALDLAKLIELGYKVLRAIPVDLFPHTPHLECVFTLERDSDWRPPVEAERETSVEQQPGADVFAPPGDVKWVAPNAES